MGLRDRSLLESALDPEADLASLAASYGFGIAQNHPFVDGNKRVAFQAMYLFLGLNGYRVDAPEEDVVALILALASGQVDEAALAAWLRSHISAR